MKTFNKTYLPEIITYKGTQYRLNIEASHEHRRQKIQMSSRYHIQVNCLSNNLKGKTDLHGHPYKANVWIYSSELGFLDFKTPRKLMLPESKELRRIKQFGYGV